jgi:pimeloyl-ACP methyl ester carboxylesterase
MFMRNYMLMVVCTLLVVACKPYQSTIMRDDQLTYDRFRESQVSFDTSEGTIRYIDRGAGPVLLLLHGVPTSGWLYRKMIDPLVEAGYRVIAPDMLGFGSSDSPEGYEIYAEDMHAQRLLELMDFLEISTWTHITHDAGGLWTWELLEQDSKRIEKLVILNTIIYEEGFSPPIRFKKGFMARTAMWSYRNGITTNMMLQKLFNGGMIENTLNEADIEGYKRPLREGKTKAMYYFFTQTCNTLPNYQPMIQALDLPTTIIWGKNDSFLLLEPQQDALQKDLKLQEEDIHILDAKHFIQEEKPEEIVQMILTFIK